MIETIQLVRESEIVLAVLIFSIAFAEAFIFSTFLLPGTLLTIGLGGLVRSGALPPWVAAATWAGTFFGDLSSYFIARRLGGCLRRIGRLSRVLDRGESAFVKRPTFYLLASRCSPYLKATGPTLAGLSRLPLAAFLLINFVASGLDAGFFLALGYFGTAAAFETSETNRIASFIGLAVVCTFVYFLARECLRPPASCRCAQGASSRKRGFMFKLRCAFLLVPWNVCGWVEEWLGFWNRNCIRRMALRCLSRAQVGDIVLLARGYAAPWGTWTHAALVTSTKAEGLIIHAYGRVIEESYNSLPKRCRMAVLRVQASPETIEQAVTEARKQLGKRFSLAAGKPTNGVPNAFNCAGLVWFCFHRAGCDLVETLDAVVTPQDLADSSSAKLVCELRCPERSSQAGGSFSSETWPQHVSDLCSRLVAIMRTRRVGRRLTRLFSLLK